MQQSFAIFGYLADRRLWSKVSKAVTQNDLDAATDEKIVIEDKQREDAKYREENGIKWKPRYFDQIDKDQYEFKGIQRYSSFVSGEIMVSKFSVLSIDFKSPKATKELQSMLFDSKALPEDQAPQAKNGTLEGSTPKA